MTENLLSNMSYTNKSFQDIYPELLDLAKKITYRWDPTQSNESDPGVVLLKLCAIIADKQNYNIDKNILECFPVSVAQDNNARALFEQLGYLMHWYLAASTDIQISWRGSNEEEKVYNLPRFTMVSNDDNSIVYTLTSDVSIDTDGSVVTCPALQGVLQDFMINGDPLITTANLDSNNRIYFQSYNVAENGIFIKNDLYDYVDWKKVDNLATEDLGQPVYKFGITQDGNSCYLEFPEDAFDIFNNGIYIKYIITDGEDGNITAGSIERFFNDPSAVDSSDPNNTVLLTSENVRVTNSNSARNGLNPESISDAYSNYKKTIGTFNTLVTLRDYCNAIRTAKINNVNIVSNGFVTDRTNDIQCSYNIVSDVDDSLKTTLCIENSSSVDFIDEDGNKHFEKEINAFDLKLYLLENISSSNNIIQPGEKSYKVADSYNKTFNLIDNTSYSSSYQVDMIEQYLEDQKSLQHNFQPILSDKLCMLKNKYPINCKIIPQYKLTSIQAEDVKNNVIIALYNNLNSRKIDFGSDISYDDLYNIIINADERIKSIMLDYINYTTYAIYYDSYTQEFTEIEINELKEFINGYYNEADDRFYSSYDPDSNQYYGKIELAFNAVYKDCITSSSESIKKLYLTSQEYSNIFENDSIEIGSKLIVNFRNNAVNSSEFDQLRISLYNAQTDESYDVEYPIKAYNNGIKVDLSQGMSLLWNSGDTRVFTFDGSSWVINFVNTINDINSKYTYVDIPTGKCYMYRDGKTSDDIKSDFQTEIYAKSVLAGKTQLLTPDNIFEYRLNHRFIDSALDISNISTNANIRLKGIDTGDGASTVLKENESIRFYAPNLIDDRTYSSFVKFQYDISNDIEPNADYLLGEDESITFYWKESDDASALYNYYKYGEGTIIQPNFRMQVSVGYRTQSSEDRPEYFGASLINGSGTLDPSQSSILSSVYDNNYILSSNKSVKIRKTVETTVKYPQYCYWILNDRKSTNINNNYVYKLFDSAKAEKDEINSGYKEIVQTYILQPGEYFIYTDASKSSLEILSSGTKITRRSNSKEINSMTCYVSNIDSIISDGISSSDDYFRQINFGETLTFTEMQIKTVPADATLYLSAEDWRVDQSDTSQNSGTRIYGEGQGPSSGLQAIRATKGGTAYNSEYSSSYKWHEDTDSNGNEKYSSAKGNYCDNIDISSLKDKSGKSIDPKGLTPQLAGIISRFGYSKLNTLNVPDFTENTFYQIIDKDNTDIYDDKNYVLLDKEPANWETEYINYYWKQSIHVYNPKFSSEIIWENDNTDSLSLNDKTPYKVEWVEDTEYLALGTKVNQNDVFPDLIKLDLVPEDKDSVNVLSLDNIHEFEKYYNVLDKDQEIINTYLVILSTNKYVRVGTSDPYDWYLIAHYKDSLDKRFPIDTYHAYNSKYQENGLVWTSDNTDPDDRNEESYIRITGENCTPYRCILMVDNYNNTCYTNDDGTLKIWQTEGMPYVWEAIESAPSDSTTGQDGNTLEVQEGSPNDYATMDNFNKYLYLHILNPSQSSISSGELSVQDPNSSETNSSETNGSWYQRTQKENYNWIVQDPDNYIDSSHENPLDKLIEIGAIELTVGSDPSTGDYVSIIPKDGLFAINTISDDSSMDAYPITYFKADIDYIEKSWTQKIIFSDSAIDLDNKKSYTDPGIEGLTPSLGEHAFNQRNAYVWLEDFVYSFEDNVVSNISNVVGNARSVSGVGVTPNDENLKIVATEGSKAYNPSYSYKFEWLEDESYTQWTNPIVMLTGPEDDPYTSKISVYALDQHVVNPLYESSKTWIRLNSPPSKYSNYSVGSGDSSVHEFIGTSVDTPPDIDASVSQYDNIVYCVNTNTETFTWWQRSAVLGKSWTSTRIPVGKSWTAYLVEVSESWSGVDDFVGKSWHVELDSIGRKWRSVSVPVDVIFTGNGPIINNPAGYTLNDFTIRSKLKDSTEIEEWPRVLVGDGWEAYSSLDFNVSQNTPLELYENQSIDWFNKDYNEEFNNTEKTHGTIDGSYSWEKESDISEYDDYTKVNAEVQSFSKNYINATIYPSESVHLYDKNRLLSWTSKPMIVLGEVEAGFNDNYNNIIVNSFDNLNPDRVGIHYYNETSNETRTSIASNNYYFEEDEEFIENGLNIDFISSSINENDKIISIIGDNIRPIFKYILINTLLQDEYFVSRYHSIYLVSDYGYSLEGGQMLDVSRINTLGKKFYMNLYSYDDISYEHDNGIILEDNLLKINYTGYNEFEDLYGTATPFESNVYYEKYGDGSRFYPYEYILLESEPDDWSSARNKYYKETDYFNKVADSANTYLNSRYIDFNFPDGKYVLTIMNSVVSQNSSIEGLTIDLYPIKNYVEQQSYITLHEFNDVDLNNFNKNRKYYLDLDLDHIRNDIEAFNDCDTFRLKIKIKIKKNNFIELRGFISFYLAYKYDKPNYISDNLFEAVLNKMHILDEEDLYDYTYVVSDDINIKNPLDANSFLNENHVYNEFTICQIDTENSDVYITNSN